MCRSATIANVADPAVGGVLARLCQARVLGHGSVIAPRAQVAEQALPLTAGVAVDGRRSVRPSPGDVGRLAGDRTLLRPVGR
jgi:hypothetical protein